MYSTMVDDIDSANKYRRMATIDRMKLKLFLESRESIEFKATIYEKLSNDELFKRDDWSTKSVDQCRLINVQRCQKLHQYAFVDWDALKSDPDRFGDLIDVLECYDQSLAASFFLTSGAFYLAILSLGAPEHHSDLLQKLTRNEITGSYCLTELAHGSNVREIRTECHFENGAFRLHTPDDRAIKCWAGNLSVSATHAIVFAQLYVRDVCHGVHAFCVEIRENVTKKPLDGIAIGDMGEKPGVWNAIENGWMKFTNHRIPLSSLLSRAASVNSAGDYVCQYQDPQKRHAAMLGGLSIGRAAIVGKGAVASRLASVIAIRYSTIRQLPGDRSVIEHPMQQKRIFPALATAIALTIFHRQFIKHCFQHFIVTLDQDWSKQNFCAKREIHVLSCATKAIATSAGVRALAEARLACGGHGFLKCSRLNDLYDAFDPSQTYEGDNNLLLNHAGLTLIRLFTGADDDRKQAAFIDGASFGSFQFLGRKPSKFEGPTDDQLNDVTNAYEWLLIEMLNECSTKPMPAEQFEKHLSLATLYGELAIIQSFQRAIMTAAQHELELQMVLEQLCTIYAYTNIQKHLVDFEIYGFSANPDCQWPKLARQRLHDAQRLLLPNALAICDSIAPPDFILHSALGREDGRFYAQLIQDFQLQSDSDV